MHWRILSGSCNEFRVARWGLLHVVRECQTTSVKKYECHKIIIFFGEVGLCIAFKARVEDKGGACGGGHC